MNTLPVGSMMRLPDTWKVPAAGGGGGGGGAAVGVGVGVGGAVGFAVGVAVGLDVGLGVAVGRAVGLAVVPGVGVRVGAEVGLAVVGAWVLPGLVVVVGRGLCLAEGVAEDDEAPDGLGRLATGMPLGAAPVTIGRTP